MIILKNKKFKVFTVILLTVVILCIGLYLYNRYFISNEIKPAAVKSDIQKEDVVPSEYEEYYKKNTDFVGWIKIENTNIDYPVVQTDNNDYYLSHNFEKEPEGRGSIYMDCICSPDLSDKNTVIYGHNWLDTTMFSELTKYNSFDFYKKHPVIEFNTISEMHKWKIFAVFITSASESEDNGYVFNYIYPHMEGENFYGYKKEIDKRTLFYTGVDVNESDQILTLSTCTRAADKGKNRADCRIVIVARMVREGESDNVDVSKALINDNPKYPQIWYDNNDMDNPYINDEKWYPVDLNTD